MIKNAQIVILGTGNHLSHHAAAAFAAVAPPQALPKIKNAQIVILGTGKAKYEQLVKGMSAKNPNFKGVVKFSAPMAHQITAGADFILVPSRWVYCVLHDICHCCILCYVCNSCILSCPSCFSSANVPEFMYPAWRASTHTFSSVSAAESPVVLPVISFLSPNRFEPCGLIQLHSMQYSTLCMPCSTSYLSDLCLTQSLCRLALLFDATGSSPAA
jgi:hypothetical protein